MKCYGVPWYAVVCYGMLWYALVCYGMLWYSNNNNNTLFQTIVHMDNKKKYNDE